MSDKFEASWAAFRGETPTNNQPLMRKAFHAGWDARDAGLRAVLRIAEEANNDCRIWAGKLQAAQDTIAEAQKIIPGIRHRDWDELTEAEARWAVAYEAYAKGEK